MTDTEKAALCRRIDELCEENERLRQEGRDVGMAGYELGRKSMADENAKLRELADGLTWCADMRGCCSECPLYDKSEPDHCREPRLKRELKIEVVE